MLVGAGVLPSAVTENAMRPTIERVRYHPEAEQRLFRSAISQFLSVHFDPIETIRRNRSADFGPLTFLASVN
jgi:hypothetical protein